MKIKLELEEIARCLYKLHWADRTEYNKAFEAAISLSSEDFKAYRIHVLKHYGIDVTGTIDNGN